MAKTKKAKDKKFCIWMEAGVVSYKTCPYEHNCTNCEYDRAMRRKLYEQEDSAAIAIATEKKKDKDKESWKDRFLRLPAYQRKCRHMIMGAISHKICPNGFDCANCSYDQLINEAYVLMPPKYGEDIIEVGGFRISPRFHYHRGHSWGSIEYGGTVRVGVDDFGQKLLGQVEKVELPRIGEKVKFGEVAWAIGRSSKLVEVLSPVEGVVSHINYDLLENPERVNSDPYQEGWLLILEPENLKKSLRSLFYGESTEAWILSERDRLYHTLQNDVGITAADGGIFIQDITKTLGDEEWARLNKEFFLT